MDAGVTPQYTYLTDGTVTIQTSPVVSDDGNPVMPGVTTVLWTLQSGVAENVTINSPTAQNTTMTFTAVGDYTLQLTADDGELTNTDTITVVVAPDACAAAKRVPGYPRRPSDINDDCHVNLSDLQLLAADWLFSTALP